MFTYYTINTFRFWSLDLLWTFIRKFTIEEQEKSCNDSHNSNFGQALIWLKFARKNRYHCIFVYFAIKLMNIPPAANLIEGYRGGIEFNSTQLISQWTHNYSGDKNQEQGLLLSQMTIRLKSLCFIQMKNLHVQFAWLIKHLKVFLQYWVNSKYFSCRHLICP